MKGIIYCIKSLNSNVIYIGSSKQSITTRKSKHIYDSKHSKRCKPVHRYINENGTWSNYVFEKLEQKEYDNIKQLREEEYKTIQKYKENNYQLLNAKLVSSNLDGL
jgi:hypothetical protein